MIALTDLIGAWHLDRVIEDRRTGLTGRMTGRAVWRPDGAGLRQDEDGRLTYGAAAPMQASRSYLWRQEGAALAVFFEDGRRFHVLDPERPQDRHWCDPDTYDVTYDLLRWPDWGTVWQVSGPRKDMTIRTRFFPA